MITEFMPQRQAFAVESVGKRYAPGLATGHCWSLRRNWRSMGYSGALSRVAGCDDDDRDPDLAQMLGSQ
ncbi:hypothetical protein ACNKHK_14980 [Shigella flexneri]